ncbi:unnamed protein product [Effrenium voratum]|nr:unnamed protein product [Effrenium voratum]
MAPQKPQVAQKDAEMQDSAKTEDEVKEGALVLAEPSSQVALRARRSKALVPLFVEEKGHGRDGELLRDFIRRREHLKKDCRDLAVNRWLIRGDFFDEFLKEYAEQYAPGDESVDEAALSEQAGQMVEACKDIMVEPKSRKKVEELEVVAKSTDVYELRDTLLAAVKDLTTPRRRLGVHTNNVMPDSAKEFLKKQNQMRLRKVVLQCLKGIWESGVGGEVLQMALDTVKTRIDRRNEDALEKPRSFAAQVQNQLRGL